MLDSYFKLSEHGTTLRTELIAGGTTFLAMSYIIFVNPEILSAAGMDHNAVFVATCLAAAIGSLIMGLYANYPIALAPGMGLNAYFAFTVVGTLGYSWQVALGAVFISGCCFDAQYPACPGVDHRCDTAFAEDGDCRRHRLPAGDRRPGKRGRYRRASVTLVTVGDLSKPTTILAGIGFVAIAALTARKVPARSLSAFCWSPEWR